MTRKIVMIIIAAVLLLAVVLVQKSDAQAIDTSELLAAGPAVAICEWIHANVKWIGDTPLRIKRPAETLFGGDCADQAGLMIWMLADQGLRAELILMDLDDFEAHHAVVLFRGVYYDPVDGSWCKPEDFRLAHVVNYAIEGSVLLKEFGE